MARVVDTKEYLDMVCELLAQGKEHIAVPVAGSSMTPFLHPGDTVYVDLPGDQLRAGDIPLFVRPDGRYILHRIVKVRPDGSFIMLGDYQTETEVVESIHQIRAVVTSAKHKGKILTPKSPRWIFFATVWRWIVPFRYSVMRVWGKIKKITR